MNKVSILLDACFESQKATGVLVSTIIRVMGESDPGLTHARSAWRMNRSAHFGIRVGVDNLDVHFAVEGDDMRMLDALQRKLAADESFLRLDPGELMGAMELPGGSAIITVLGDALLIQLQRSGIVVSPAIRTAEGLAMVPSSNRWQGMRLALAAGQMTAVLMRPEMLAGADNERDILTRPLTVYVRRMTPQLLAFGIGTGETLFDLFFALGIEPPESRRLRPRDGDGSMSILLQVARSEDGVIEVERVLTPNAAFSEQVEDLLVEQAAAPNLTVEECRVMVRSFEAAYPDPWSLFAPGTGTTTSPA